MSKNTRTTDADQAARFAEAARLAECDPDEAAFDAALATIARHKPGPKPAKKPRAGAPRARPAAKAG